MTRSSRLLARRTELFAAALEWEGVRFHHQGRSRAGLDCIGLLVRSYETCGVELVDHVAYGRRPNPKMFTAQLERQFDECTAEAAEIEVFWWNAETRKPQHLGVLNGDLTRVVHTWFGVRKVVDSPRDELWQERHVSYWKLKEELWLPSH